MNKLALGALFWISLIAYSNAASPLFVSAITSALATIPFSGGPMTTGLVGAKLGIGTKLLYYLGYFGRQAPTPKQKPKAKKKAAAKPKLTPLGESGFPSQSFQSMPPSGFPNNFPPASNLQNPFSNVDPSTLFQALIAQGVDPNVAMQAINYAGNTNPAPNAFAGNTGFGTSGSFGAGGAGFPAGSGFPSGMSGGAGFPASSGFQSGMSGAGFPAGSGFPSGMSGGAGFPAGGFPTGMPGGSGFPAGGFQSGMAGGSGFPAGGFSSAIPAQQFGAAGGAGGPPGGAGGAGGNQPTQPEDPDSEEEAEDDAESFFTFMQDMDENTCISRLICDIGRDPSFLGEFSENISSMVSSLKVPPTSRAFKYIEIMESGKRDAQCDVKFPECGDVSYEVVKNVAPSVSIPQNVNSADINF